MNADIMEIWRDRTSLVLPDLHGLGWCDTRLPRLGGLRKDGLDYLEIGYLHRGTIEWLTAAGLEETGAGSVVIDWPGDWQGGREAIIHPCERYWIRLDPAELTRLPGLGAQTAALLKERFDRLTRRHFAASPEIKGFFDQMLTQQRQPGLFAEELSRAAFHQLLFTVVNDHDHMAQRAPAPPIATALEYIAENVSAPIRVATLARRAGLSTGYFHELFLRETGTTPNRYHLECRIHAAKSALVRASDASITELALSLGFSSSQYFATVFKQQVGLTPGAYRSLRAGAGEETRIWLDELAKGAVRNQPDDAKAARLASR